MESATNNLKESKQTIAITKKDLLFPLELEFPSAFLFIYFFNREHFNGGQMGGVLRD